LPARIYEDEPASTMVYELDHGMYGERRAGRPTTRWLDDVENNLKKISVNQWKIKARDRVKWRSITVVVLA
jgi:hypothetical protein